MFISYSATPEFVAFCCSILNLDLATFLLVFAVHLLLKNCGISRVQLFDQAKWTFLRGHLSGFSGNLSNISPDIASIDSHKTLDTSVSLMRPVKVASKPLYETNLQSLFFFIFQYPCMFQSRTLAHLFCIFFLMDFKGKQRLLAVQQVQCRIKWFRCNVCSFKWFIFCRQAQTNVSCYFCILPAALEDFSFIF